MYQDLLQQVLPIAVSMLPITLAVESMVLPTIDEVGVSVSQY